MREFKFRAWWEGKLYPRVGVDLSSCELYKAEWNPNWMANPPWEASIGLECDGLVVEQFTGLNDKNGRGIYEGDIFTMYQKGQKVMDSHIVELADFLGGHYWIVNKGGKPEYEILGNMHENPELMK